MPTPLHIPRKHRGRPHICPISDRWRRMCDHNPSQVLSMRAKGHVKERKSKTKAQSWTVWTMVCVLSPMILSHHHHTSWINLEEHCFQHTMDSGRSLLQQVCRSNSGSSSDTTHIAEDMSGGEAVCRRGSMRLRKSTNWIRRMRRWRGLRSGGWSRARLSSMRSRKRRDGGGGA